MSTTTQDPPATPESLIERAESHMAHFAIRWLPPKTAVVTAHGEIDAANAQQLVDYAMRHSDRIDRLVLDMSGIDFFGTSGFSALHSLNVRCAGESIIWASVPSPAVARLERICDPESALPFFSGVDSALSAVQGEPPPLLQLVPQAR
ncbi:STAS domain-containing protein [Mycobacterium sp. NPDC051804]|uniref:STAS domain-containing protein n=1 Tax=Mycobacterium sp. NPDC051804 TaxID=3364295 RepID=UPI0037907296